MPRRRTSAPTCRYPVGRGHLQRGRHRRSDGHRRAPPERADLPGDAPARWTSRRSCRRARTMDDRLPAGAPARDGGLPRTTTTAPSTEIRYAEPGWNPYVYHDRRATSPLEQLRGAPRGRSVEFTDEMTEDHAQPGPLRRGSAPRTRAAASKKQLDFMEKFRGWKKNHEQLQMNDQDMMLRPPRTSTCSTRTTRSRRSRTARASCVNGRFESDAGVHRARSSRTWWLQRGDPRVRPQPQPAAQLLRLASTRSTCARTSSPRP